MEKHDRQSDGKGGDATCPVCGASFECKLSAECWCSSVNVPSEVREYLADRYDTCLCRDCLEKLVKKAGAGELS
ncbi:cysteine-rich CWC family protein [Prosthecochloris sp. SCSIO W1101]|uniref:cysteine-rich CWC family protein n=1 Tax=Prosthecochloris sp. SCSIO W1101 TaxID=2992242 RepID=UPI00223C93B2|nr:cysteine-rich CWC family protein [Prosthecochloris sp. SCSIO W1101]UZJ40474.1 cysteine-rich CWC family protein [Prosthecochloris sp. SCSIO W1101]